MIKTVLIDAYNVIYEIPALHSRLEESLLSSRKALKSLVISWKNEHSFKGAIIIVFDGQDNMWSTEKTKFSNMKCIFTGSKEEADDRIITLLKNSKDPSEILTISNDNKVINGCKVYGAQTKPPSYLLEKRKQKTSKPDSKRHEKVTSSKVKEINDYCKKAWGIG